MHKSREIKFIKKENFVASKKFGQNFLINDNIKDKIVKSASLEKNDLVVEIGPGLGAITEIILKQKNYLLAIELDKRLFDYLNKKFCDIPNFRIINNDYLKLNTINVINEISKIKNLNRKIVIANLPYSISSLIIAKICLEKIYDLCIIMVQKEMALRIVAKPNSKNYNAFTVWLNKFIDVEFLFDVGPKNFIPSPKVISSVVKITFKNQRNDFDYEKYRKFLNKCFLSRRKTLFNNLVQHYPREKIKNIFLLFNINNIVRAQELKPDTLFELFIKFTEKEEN